MRDPTLLPSSGEAHSRACEYRGTIQVVLRQLSDEFSPQGALYRVEVVLLHREGDRFAERAPLLPLDCAHFRSVAAMS